MQQQSWLHTLSMNCSLTTPGRMSPNPACSLHSNSAVPLHLLPLPGAPGQQLCAALPRPARQPLCALLFGAQWARDHPLYVSQGRHLPLSCRRQNGEAQRYCAGTCTGAAAHAGLPCGNGTVCRQSQSAAVLLRHEAAAPYSLFLLPQQPPLLTIRAAPLHLPAALCRCGCGTCASTAARRCWRRLGCPPQPLTNKAWCLPWAQSAEWLSCTMHATGRPAPSPPSL